MIKKDGKGFTLIELLVVIAIIGILAVVAVPNLLRNIQKARVSEFEADYNAIRSAILIDYAENGELQRGFGDLSNIDKYMENIDKKTPFGGIYYIEVYKEIVNSNNQPGNNLSYSGYRLQEDGTLGQTKEDVKDEYIVALRVGTEYEGSKAISTPKITKEQFIKISNEIGTKQVYSHNQTFDRTSNPIYIGIIPK